MPTTKHNSLTNLHRVPKLHFTELTQALLKAHVHYDPVSGIFTLLKTNSPRFKNKRPESLGTPDVKGYLHAMVCGVRRKLHVMAVLYVTGVLPDRAKLEVVDHINGVKTDNRWENLRVISGGENVRNQSQVKSTTASGLTGVNKLPNGKYKANIRIDKRLYHLGTYASLEEAQAARLKALKAHLDSQALAYGQAKGVLVA
jgi:hypothetical protein